MKKRKVKENEKKMRTRTWSTTQHIRKHPKKGWETPTSGCACARPREPLRLRDHPVAMLLPVMRNVTFCTSKEKKPREK